MNFPKNVNMATSWHCSNPQEHKVFMTNVRYPAVREALERRGWIQKHAFVGTIPETLMSPIGEGTASSLCGSLARSRNI